MKKVLKFITVIVTLFCLESYAQNSSYIILSSHDTIYIDKFNILNKKVKTIANGNKKIYAYEELLAIYDFKKGKYFEKISPSFIEYKDATGNTFFAERLTKGKIRIYKYLTNQSHLPISNERVGFVNGSNSFFSFYIGIEGSSPELLGYKEIQMTKEEYKILKLYLHSNENIQNELEKLFFSETKEKHSSAIELVNDYNKWAESNSSNKVSN